MEGFVELIYADRFPASWSAMFSRDSSSRPLADRRAFGARLASLVRYEPARCRRSASGGAYSCRRTHSGHGWRSPATSASELSLPSTSRSSRFRVYDRHRDLPARGHLHSPACIGDERIGVERDLGGPPKVPHRGEDGVVAPPWMGDRGERPEAGRRRLRPRDLKHERPDLEGVEAQTAHMGAVHFHVGTGDPLAHQRDRPGDRGGEDVYVAGRALLFLTSVHCSAVNRSSVLPAMLEGVLPDPRGLLGGIGETISETHGHGHGH